jgi:UDP-N-acetyl-D-glucosamine/UDP-N-acetyl-D-galactosamine dehydrogenase
MGAYVANQLIKAMSKRRIQIEGSSVLVMGLTLKENCLDLRNTRVVDIVAELQDYHCAVDVYDPRVSAAEAKQEYGNSPMLQTDQAAYDEILAVAHCQFKAMGVEAIRGFGHASHILYDLKYLFPAAATDLRL